MPLLADPKTCEPVSVAEFEAAFAGNHPSITYGLQRVVAPERVWTGSMIINIKTLTGKTVLLNVDPSDTIEDVKYNYEDKEGVPADQQRLIFNGTLPEDGSTLAELKITHQSVIHLTLKLSGD